MYQTVVGNVLFSPSIKVWGDPPELFDDISRQSLELQILASDHVVDQRDEERRSSPDDYREMPAGSDELQLHFFGLHGRWRRSPIPTVSNRPREGSADSRDHRSALARMRADARVKRTIFSGISCCHGGRSGTWFGGTKRRASQPRKRAGVVDQCGELTAKKNFCPSINSMNIAIIIHLV